MDGVFQRGSLRLRWSSCRHLMAAEPRATPEPLAGALSHLRPDSWERVPPLLVLGQVQGTFQDRVLRREGRWKGTGSECLEQGTNSRGATGPDDPPPGATGQEEPELVQPGAACIRYQANICVVPRFSSCTEGVPTHCGPHLVAVGSHRRLPAHEAVVRGSDPSSQGRLPVAGPGTAPLPATRRPGPGSRAACSGSRARPRCWPRWATAFYAGTRGGEVYGSGRDHAPGPPDTGTTGSPQRCPSSA